MTLADRIERSHHDAVRGMDIPWLLDTWARRAPHKPFMIWEPFEGGASTWTYLQLQSEARSVAAGLHQRGVRAGEFVIIHLDNAPEFVVAWYACAELGAIAVSTNTRCVARDMAYFADHTSAVAAITQPAYAELIHNACSDLDLLVVTDHDGGVPASSETPHVPWGDLLEQTATLPLRATEPDAPLGVQFTSGTTSRPKAVLWTHANGIWAARVNASHMRLRKDDVTLVFMPLFHTNAQAYSMLASHWIGGTFVLQPRFSASRFWDVSLRHGVSWCSTIPFAFKALAGQPVPEHQYRFWGTAAHLPQVAEHFRVDIIGWWGMTETLTHGIVTDPDQPGPAGTIGRVAPEYDIDIRTEDGAPAQPGERGVLHIRGVRGVSLFQEYYGNREANAAAFDDDGFFDTGDIVRMDEHGWLFFSDREKDMLKVGAENVAASEIESVIMQTGFVSEVAVVGQKHPMLDEVPVAFVIPLPNSPEDLEARIIAYCREALADFKVVRAVHIVASLPRSTLEKVAKNELRAQLPALSAESR